MKIETKIESVISGMILVAVIAVFFKYYDPPPSNYRVQDDIGSITTTTSMQ